MNAGREMDALIAEKVMGWKRDAEYFVAENGALRSLVYDFCPSTDIAAAREFIWKIDNEVKVLSTSFTFRRTSLPRNGHYGTLLWEGKRGARGVKEARVVHACKVCGHRYYGERTAVACAESHASPVSAPPILPPPFGPIEAPAARKAVDRG